MAGERDAFDLDLDDCFEAPVPRQPLGRGSFGGIGAHASGAHASGAKATQRPAFLGSRPALATLPANSQQPRQAAPRPPGPAFPQVARQLPGPAGKLQQLHAEGHLAQATPEALGLHDEEGGGGGGPTLSQTAAGLGGSADATFLSTAWQQAQAFLRSGTSGTAAQQLRPVAQVLAAASGSCRVGAMVVALGMFKCAGGSDAFVRVKDPSGSMGAALHASALAPQLGLSPGCVVVLRQVVAFSAAPGLTYLCVTADNVDQVFAASTLSPLQAHHQRTQQQQQQGGGGGRAGRRPAAQPQQLTPAFAAAARPLPPHQHTSGMSPHVAAGQPPSGAGSSSGAAAWQGAGSQPGAPCGGWVDGFAMPPPPTRLPPAPGDQAPLGRPHTSAASEAPAGRVQRGWGGAAGGGGGAQQGQAARGSGRSLFDESDDEEGGQEEVVLGQPGSGPGGSQHGSGQAQHPAAGSVPGVGPLGPGSRRSASVLGAGSGGAAFGEGAWDARPGYDDSAGIDPALAIFGSQLVPRGLQAAAPAAGAQGSQQAAKRPRVAAAAPGGPAGPPGASGGQRPGATQQLGGGGEDLEPLGSIFDDICPSSQLTYPHAKPAPPALPQLLGGWGMAGRGSSSGGGGGGSALTGGGRRAILPVMRAAGGAGLDEELEDLADLDA